MLVGCGGYDGFDGVEWRRMVASMGDWDVDTVSPVLMRHAQA